MTSEVFAPQSISPLRKRSRADISERRHKTKSKLSSPPPRRLRMRIDRSDRIWAGRCGCKSPNCMADEFEFSSGSSASSTSDSSDEESEEDGGDEESDAGHDEDCEDKSCKTKPRLQTGSALVHTGQTRPPQDPNDLVPMMLHLMLMM